MCTFPIPLLQTWPYSLQTYKPIDTAYKHEDIFQGGHPSSPVQVNLRSCAAKLRGRQRQLTFKSGSVGLRGCVGDTHGGLVLCLGVKIGREHPFVPVPQDLQFAGHCSPQLDVGVNVFDCALRENTTNQL